MFLSTVDNQYLVGASSPSGHSSKYPPAKPGALRCEPLKAAYPGGFGAVSHLLRGMLHTVAKLTMLITCVCGWTPICRGVIFASSSIDGTPFRVLWRPTDSELHRWPMDPTSGNVKLLLPPRQSRGNSHYGLADKPRTGYR